MRRSSSDSLETTSTDSPGSGGDGNPPPPPADPAGAPGQPGIEAGVSLVRYQGPKDRKGRQPKAVPAVVVAVDGAGVCTLKLLDRKDSPRVEGVPYAADRTDAARWF